MSRNIFALGEALIDECLIEGKKVSFVGGAALNFSFASHIITKDTYFVGVLCSDVRSKIIKEAIKKEEISSHYILTDDNTVTAYSEVLLDENGDRNFVFHQENANYLDLSKVDFLKDVTANDFFYFGTVVLQSKTNQEYFHYILSFLKNKGTTIVMDPNIRLNLFDEGTIVNLIKEYLIYPTILKLAEDELMLVIPHKNKDEAIKMLFSLYPNLKLILLTLGKEGVIAYTQNDSILVPSFKVEVKDTTGAGDTFLGVLIGLLSLEIESPYDKASYFVSMLKTANEVAAKVCTHYGCIPILQ